jgi:hypothetical protein
MPRRLALVERARWSSTRRSWSSVPLSRRVREIPEDFPDRVAQTIRVMVVGPVFARSPWGPLIPAVSGHSPSERPPRGRSSEARIVEGPVDRQSAALEGEVYASATADDVPPLGVTLDPREDAEPSRRSEGDEVEVRDSGLSGASRARRVRDDGVDREMSRPRGPEATRDELRAETREEVREGLIVRSPLSEDMPSTARELDEEERAGEPETEVESEHRPH